MKLLLKIQEIFYNIIYDMLRHSIIQLFFFNSSLTDPDPEVSGH